jgi:probable HAF family extracellular repeat protein
MVWNNGGLTDLGTFGGNISTTSTLDNKGQVVGEAANTTADAYASGLGPCSTVNCWPVATQLRAFIWQKGVMQDLGTLGGNDAAASLINNRGQVAGVSYTNTTPNATTGLPTQDPFFWDKGSMTDIGTLGGAFGYPWWMNDKGLAQRRFRTSSSAPAPSGGAEELETKHPVWVPLPPKVVKALNACDEGRAL